jgi:hypothetical protein
MRYLHGAVEQMEKENERLSEEMGAIHDKLEDTQNKLDRE